MEKTKKIKTFIGLSYLILVCLFLYFFFSKFSLQDLTSYDFIKQNRSYFFELKNSNLFLISITFLLLIGAFIGACSGSVGGGIKSWRVLIMINHAKINIMRLVHPNAVVSLKIGSKAVDDKVAESVWGFFSIYVICFMLLLLSLLATGMDFESSFSAIGACLNNLGPGLGQVAETYGSVSDIGKSILALAMILGRLEIFTLLVLFTTVFWQK